MRPGDPVGVSGHANAQCWLEAGWRPAQADWKVLDQGDRSLSVASAGTQGRQDEVPPGGQSHPRCLGAGPSQLRGLGGPAALTATVSPKTSFLLAHL